MKILLVILMVTVPTVLAAKAKPDWQKAVVIDQLDTLYSGATDSLPMAFGIPAKRQHKILVLDTDQGFRVTLEETACVWHISSSLPSTNRFPITRKRMPLSCSTSKVKSTSLRDSVKRS